MTCRTCCGPAHLAQLRGDPEDPEASANDRFVALDLLKNANIAAGGVLPMCQDTGTAIVFGKKGQRVWVEGDEEEALSYGRAPHLHRDQPALLADGAADDVRGGQHRQQPAGAVRHLRRPGRAPRRRVPPDVRRSRAAASANKTFLYQQTRAVLNKPKLLAFLEEKIKTLGTSACPPYHLAIVIGGTSAETDAQDGEAGLHPVARHAADDRQRARATPSATVELEAEVHKLTQNLGIGAQFGGKYFCHDVRIMRLPRHGASLPIGIGVSCSADRQIKAKITPEGVFLEQLEHDPARFLPEQTEDILGGEVVRIDLNRPMAEIRASCRRYPVKTRVSLTGTIVVARDIAHAKLKERLDCGAGLPRLPQGPPGLLRRARPRRPRGWPPAPSGPTTAGRMDSYVPSSRRPAARW